MTERKSLLARFDEENIIKLAVSDADPGILWLTFIDEDGKEITRPFSTEGGYGYEVADVTIKNESVSNINFNDLYSYADHGLFMFTTVAAGNTETLYASYILRNGHWGVNFSNTNGKTVEVLETTNAHLLKGNFVAVDDPTLPSSISIKLA